MNGEEFAVCGHMRVNYFTSAMDENGVVRGWWECIDCDMEFVPKPALKEYGDSKLREAVAIIKKPHPSRMYQDELVAEIEGLMEDAGHE